MQNFDLKFSNPLITLVFMMLPKIAVSQRCVGRRLAQLSCLALVLLAAGPLWAHQMPAAEKALQQAFYTGSSAGELFTYFLLAFGLGTLHALTPGHGKSVIAAFLIGSRGRVIDAVILGTATATTHTGGVILLGLILLYAFNQVIPPKITPYLGLVSGGIIMLIGAYLFFRRKKEDHSHTHLFFGHHHHDDGKHNHGHQHQHGDSAAHSHRHEHLHEEDHHHHDLTGHHHQHDDELHHHLDHGDHHHHQHGNPHLPHSPGEIIVQNPQDPRKINVWTNIVMGVSGGLIPCPTALVILFLAVSLKQIGLGLSLIVAFSLGLAFTLTVVGILFAKGFLLFKGAFEKSRFIQKIPLISAVVVFCLGLAMAIKSLIELA